MIHPSQLLKLLLILLPISAGGRILKSSTFPAFNKRAFGAALLSAAILVFPADFSRVHAMPVVAIAEAEAANIPAADIIPAKSTRSIPSSTFSNFQRFGSS